jgi:glycosyltransferase involved in cell wall biosynthesis
MPEPVVTTVLTTYRNPGLLRRAVDSVLGQTFRELRLTIYDDASDDETEGVVAAYAAKDARVTYHRHPANIGLVRNFAFGLEQVSTPYFSFLSDDDWLLPNLYAITVRGLESNPTAAFLSRRVVHVDDEGRVVRKVDITAMPAALHHPPQGVLALLEHGAPTWTGTVFRTSAAKEIGGLDTETGDVLDVDLVLRLGARHPFLVDPRFGAVFSRRRDSVSGQVRLSSTWPGWPRMIDNLDRELSYAPEIRSRTHQVLTAQLIARIYGTGLAAARRGNSNDALQASRILSARFGSGRQARIVQLAAAAFHRIPPLRAVVPRLGRRRLPYLRSGWRRTTISLERYLAGNPVEQDTSTPAR